LKNRFTAVIATCQRESDEMAEAARTLQDEKASTINDQLTIN
jgi:hypothetical protein